MRNGRRRTLAGFTALVLGPLVALCAAEVSKPPGSGQEGRRDAMLRVQLVRPYPPNGCWHLEDFALAAYWLNERTDEADQALLAEREEEFPASLKERSFHWHAYLLERIYFLFSHESKHFPGRMGPKAESALLDMLWQWAAPRCRLEMTVPHARLVVVGQREPPRPGLVGLLGAAQIFAHRADFKDRRYADGTTPAEMAAALTAYFQRFARERAAKGLLVECNSDYNKYTLGGWYNMADFSDDPVLRRRMAMLLDLFWADWASEQIAGVRGGSSHRRYPGGTSTTDSSMDGTAWYHFGLGPARSRAPKCMCAATTFWRPSPVVVDLALDVAGRGVYESVSRRPGLAEQRKPGAPLRIS